MYVLDVDTPVLWKGLQSIPGKEMYSRLQEETAADYICHGNAAPFYLGYRKNFVNSAEIDRPLGYENDMFYNRYIGRGVKFASLVTTNRKWGKKKLVEGMELESLCGVVEFCDLKKMNKLVAHGKAMIHWQSNTKLNIVRPEWAIKHPMEYSCPIRNILKPKIIFLSAPVVSTEFDYSFDDVIEVGRRIESFNNCEVVVLKGARYFWSKTLERWGNKEPSGEGRVSTAGFAIMQHLQHITV